jgi:alkyl hydroperoxide reductase subunit F
MQEVYDLIIVGAGPAGITASVYAVRKGLSVLVISQDVGGQALWSGDVENYTGFRFLSGPQLVEKFQEHLDHYGIVPRVFERVKSVAKAAADECFDVSSETGVYRARAVIVATGKRPRRLGVPGEEEFRNRGVAFCATCDGPLFKGKDVAVIGGGNSALDAALSLMKICNRVTVVNAASVLTGDPIMATKVMAAPNVVVMNAAQVTSIAGDDRVRTLSVKTVEEETVIPLSAVFVEIGLIPNADAVACAEKNVVGEIVVDAHNRTSCEGLFAAGDVTDVPEKQIVIAAGEGAKAALSVFNWLSTRKEAG